MEIVIYGRVEGEIIAKSVELKTGSRVDGNITTSDLVIEKGALYNGQCRMEQVKKGGTSPQRLIF